ncbi:RagB/SusD family nutrient uptake outer membrane protein [Sphingobacterium chuzhouense]|uniref:RagB/SusD family nutrient uptake outer membrane protein n=1 Tax=Sphingobacterium chuzhouense TaxID=1742264 RepID=A0ABR7XXH7_9SPHI|nr:RagB/SusD family nutrient uptake outer membrane protein [Sphingobacterium chuzhouense]MBD1423733.1 RagB/SusD family nutrient uptake outer membrane protein [Sphingobacterium chuzhouense]
MKNLAKSLLFLFVISFISCESFLERPPLSELSESSFYKSPGDAAYAVNAMYDAFYELEGGNGVPYLDILTDLIFLKNSWEAGFFPATNGSLTTDNWWVNDRMWSNKYTYIRNINIFFQNIDQFQGQIPDAELNNYKGQARTIRAFLYTRLMQIFGDAPLIKEPLPVDTWPSKNTAEEIIAFIMPEFDQAISELPTDPTDAKHGRLTRYAAQVYKARAALYVAGFYNKPEYYEVAAEALSDVVNSGRFDLFKKYNDPYRDFGALFLEENEGADNPEILLSLQFIRDLDKNNISGAFAGNGWKGLQAQQNYIDMFECIDGWQKYGISFAEMNRYRDTRANPSPLAGKSPNYNPQNEFANRDPRLSQTFFNPNISGSGGAIRKSGEYWPEADMTFFPDADNDAYFFKKMVEPSLFTPLYQPGNGGNNYILVRYADVLLLYAEALNEINRTAEAVPYVNAVRNRAGMPNIVAGDKDELREIIKHERKIELIQEQQLYYDYKRWRDFEKTMPNGAVFYGFRREPFGQTSQPMQTKYLTYPKYYNWSIPAGELRNNPNLTPSENW